MMRVMGNPLEVDVSVTTRRLSVRDARATFSELLGQVHFTREPAIVEKKGRPFVAIVSLEDYEWLKRAKESAVAQAWEAIDRLQERNADKDPDEVTKDVTAELEAVPHETRETTWAVLNQIRERNADKDEEEIDRDVTEAVEEVRQQRYSREFLDLLARHDSPE